MKMNEADRNDGVVKIYWKMYPYGKNEILRLCTHSKWMMGRTQLVARMQRRSQICC